jgi:large subunit ribosomal protein L24
MKAEFNKSWVASVQPRKQRKYIANAPAHLKHKLMGSTLDRPLREKFSRRTVEVRKNDEVKAMRGRFAGKQGKVLLVDVKNTRIQIDGINRTKKDGEKVPVWFHPSKVKIIKLDESDKKRFKTGKEAKVVKKETTKTDAVVSEKVSEENKEVKEKK